MMQRYSQANSESTTPEDDEDAESGGLNAFC